MNKLKLGIPKGSLQNATIDLFKRSGWNIRVSSRNYFPAVDDPDISCALIRAQEMGGYVSDGTLDAGLTGIDWIREFDSDVVEVADLIYSKASQKPARWVVAVPGGSPYKSIEDLRGKRISTELVNYTRRYFKDKGIDVEVEFSWGATEAKVVEGLVDAVVEITETESTIKAHGLKVIHEMMETNTKLIANKAAWEDPWKKAKIKQLSLLLQGALRAEGIVGLKMNVPKEKIEAVVEILPSLHAPTVANLYQSEWLSVETVVSEAVVREIVPKLLQAGAEGVIEYPLNKLV